MSKLLNAKSLRIAMFAWEYPPLLIGGLGRVVYFLSKELVALGHEVHVFTADDPVKCPDLPEYEIDDAGVHVHRVKTQTGMYGQPWEVENFNLHIARLNTGMLQYALKLHAEKPIDLVHVHDWLSADAGWVLKSLGIPMLCTIHATEFGRNHGIHSADSDYINTTEWRLCYESGAVIVNSAHMFREVTGHFHVPAEKVSIIPNGIDPDRLTTTADIGELRQKHGVGDGPVMLFVGRIVAEKGIQVMLDAAPTVLAKYPNAKFIIAGKGYYDEHLKGQAQSMGIAESVKFFGMANDQDLKELYGIANVCVVPSLYEPFGIVALEAMAARVPLVSSDSGGLMDINEHMKVGVTTFAGDRDSLAWGILQVLDNPALAEELKAAARAKVLEQFTWTNIALRSQALYEKVISEHQPMSPIIFEGQRS